MPAYPKLATLLNPLTPIYMEVEGAKIAADTAKDWGTAAVEGAKAGAAAGMSMGLLNPLGGMVPSMPKLPELPDLGKAGDDINKLATKALIGEAILIGGVVTVAGIVAWYLSKSPEAREKVWTAGKTGARFLITKGG